MMRSILLTAFGVFLVIISLVFYLYPYWILDTRTDYYNIEAGGNLEVRMYFERGDMEEGYLTIRHGEVGSWNQDIEFSIDDPDGKPIYNAGMVKGRHDFAFAAENSGTYTFHLDNSHGEIDKRVFLLLYVRTPIYNGLVVVAALGLAFLILGLIDFSRRYRGRSRQISTI